MEENIKKNISINSENLNGIIEKKENNLNKINDLKKEIIKTNPLLKHFDVFEKSPLFEKISLKKGDMLFDEGAIDNNLYMIKKGLLSVDKYTTNERNSTKCLAVLKAGDFLGEGGLDKNAKAKEAKITSIDNTELLAIDLKKDLKKFIEENPTIGYELLKHIIIETNHRLLESNRLFAANYEIEKTIKGLKTIDTKVIFMIIDKIKSVVDVDYILYFEKHLIMQDFLTLKYDSRQPNKMQDMIFEKKGYFLDLDELYKNVNIGQVDQLIINKIGIGNEVYGYLILGREKRIFDPADKKIVSGASNSLAGVISKFLSNKEDKNKLYMKEISI